MEHLMSESDRNWFSLRECNGAESTIFSEGDNHSRIKTDIEKYERAMSYCGKCVVQMECLNYALAEELDCEMVLGGKTSQERRGMLARARARRRF